jgi:hypothetical protein
MAISILAYDLPGSSYTGFSASTGNYKKERAVRKFLVDGVNTTDKTDIITAFINLIDDASGHDLHPQDHHSNGHLPLQEVSIVKAGKRTADDVAQLWLVTATYYYAI